MKIRSISVQGAIKQSKTIALIADTHDVSFQRIVKETDRIAPDYIAVCGDILYACVPGKTIYDETANSGQHLRGAKNAVSLLEELVRIAPVFFSTGNHELYFDEEDRRILKDMGVFFLDDCYIRINEILFGGLSSPYKYFAGKGLSKSKEEHLQRWKSVFENVKTDWLDEFERQKGFKILLCHHPEFYDCFLKRRKIDLVLSGHAHGGQIRLFGRGLYAYGQGFFPKYTSGIYDQKLIVTSGLSNTSKIPRIGNPIEIIQVNLIGKENAENKI